MSTDFAGLGWAAGSGTKAVGSGQGCSGADQRWNGQEVCGILFPLQVFSGIRMAWSVSMTAPTCDCGGQHGL